MKYKLYLMLIFCFLMISCKKTDLPADKIFSSDRINVVGMDLSNMDLSQYSEKLHRANFDTETKWPNDIKEYFDYQKAMELGKDPGLGIKELHKSGITGKNIGIAIIDQPINDPHNEFKNVLKYNETYNGDKKINTYHGTAMASLTVGKNIGVAPGADLYFFGDYILTENDPLDRKVALYISKIIYDIIDLNKDLENKIRIISISRQFKSLDGNTLMNRAIQKANENHIEVITLDHFESDVLGVGLQRNMFKDPNDFHSYKAEHGVNSGTYQHVGISIPMDNRTIASYKDSGAYEYCAYGGMEFSLAYLSGLYALSLQVDPNLSYDNFIRILAETTITTNYVNIVNPIGIIKQLNDNIY